MKVFRLVLVLLLLSGLQVQIVKADPESPQSQGGTLFLPIIYIQSTQPITTGWIGPDGGSVPGLVVDPRDQNVVYAGTFGAGMFKSTDGGQNWFAINNGLPNPKIQSLAIDPVNPDILYAGTYRDERGTHFEGIYKSTDAGQSWYMSSNGIQASPIVYSIAINPENPAQIFISTRGQRHGTPDHWNGKVYRSENGGATWSELFGMSDVGGLEDFAYSLTINPTYPNQIFAATHEHGGCFSTDSGDTWTNSTIGLPDINKVNGRSVVVDPTSGQTPSVYMGIFDWTPGVFYSEDGGKDWISRKNGLGENWVYGLTLDRQAPANLFAATFTNGVYKTTDSAANWNQSGLAMNKTWIVSLAPSNSQTAYTGTFGGGVYKSLDAGSSWDHTTSGLQNAWINAVVAIPGSPLERYAALNGGGVLHSSDGGKTWGEFNNAIQDLYVNNLVYNSANNTLFALTDSHGLYRITPGGASWLPTTPALPGTTEMVPLYPEGHPLSDQELLETTVQNPDQAILAPEVQPWGTIPLIDMETAPSDPNIMYLGTQTANNCGNTCGVYRSSTGGSTWSYLGLSGMTIFNLAVSPTDPDLVYAATSAGLFFRSNSTWIDFTYPGRSFYSLHIPSNEPGTLYAGTDSGVYAWDGSNWNAKGLDVIKISALASVPGAGGKLIAGTPSGAFISLDSGTTWNPGPAELNWLTITSIQVDPVSGYVYYGTTTQGILRAPIP